MSRGGGRAIVRAMAAVPLLLLAATASTAVSGVPLPSVAAPTASAEARRLVTAQLEDYFAAEEAGGMVFLGAGLASLAAGGLLLTRSDDDVSAAAVYPTVGIGIAQAVVGIVLILRTDDQVEALRAGLNSDPFVFVDDERQRMDKVNTTFAIIEMVEIALAVAGASLFVAGELEDQPALRGVGVSVAAESLLMLGFDFLAAERGERYAGALRIFDESLRRP